MERLKRALTDCVARLNALLEYNYSEYSEKNVFFQKKPSLLYLRFLSSGRGEDMQQTDHPIHLMAPQLHLLL